MCYKDFGISVDEWELRLLGFANLKYIMEIFFQNYLSKLDEFLIIPKTWDYYGSHGAIFTLPMAFIEYFFNINDSQKYYFIRHYFNHLIFLISNFYFFLLVKERFNNWLYGIFGALFLFLSPRIFAESFYNHKDIIFLSLFIINLYYGIHFLKKPSLRNSILFSFTTALAIDIRIMGIIIAPIIVFLTYLKYLRDKNFKIFTGVTIYLFLFPLLTILFWPYLWEDPLNNFIQVFKTLSSFSLGGGYNFYLGNYYESSNVPWHYIFVWIGVTTPVFYLALFIIGFLIYTLRFIKRLIKITNYTSENNLWLGEKELEDLTYYILFISPIFIVILLNSTLYNGWRHLYFIYPCFLLISLRGLHLIDLNYFKKRNWLLKIAISIFLTQIAFVMIKDHPHQNVYFNFLSGKNVETKFELDYWGLSNKQALEFILKNDSKPIIKIGAAGPISLANSKQILSPIDKNRITISENIKSDYIIDNYINWYGKYKKSRHKVPNNFKIYKEIFVSGKRIISIYKRI